MLSKGLPRLVTTFQVGVCTLPTPVYSNWPTLYLVCHCTSGRAFCFYNLVYPIKRECRLLQPVPRGTNGGVSRLGTLSGIAGSLLIGVTFWLASFLTSAKSATLSVLPCLVIALFGGLVGNFADSVLGSTLQYSGCSQSTGRVVSMPGPGIDHICGHPVFSNSQVNLVSSLITSALTGCFACVVY